MDIVQTVTLAVGLNVVKHLIRLWLGNNLRSQDITASLDTLKQCLDIQLDQAVNLQTGERTQGSLRARLRQGLVDHFSGDELRTLCFDMSVDYESFTYQGKAGLAREIVAHLSTLTAFRVYFRCAVRYAPMRHGM